MTTPQKQFVLYDEIIQKPDSISLPIIWRPEDVRGSGWASEALRALVEWVDSYLVKPHQQLGRIGPVCPFVAPALKHNAIWMSEADISFSEEMDVVRSLIQYLEIYESLEPCDDETRELKALIVAYPSVSREKALSLVPRVHGILKADVVAKGLMLGEFYEDSVSPGIYNPTFYPLRFHIPLFVFRQMVPNDFIFLNKASDPPALRAEYIASYLKCLGPRISPERRQEARKAIESARVSP